MLYPLLIVDHEDWHRHRDYSPQIRDLLVIVFGLLDRARRKPRGFKAAYQLLRPFLDATMSPHQRLRVWYIAAQARFARDEYRPALYCLDEALDLDSRLHDTADLAQIFIDRGMLHRRLGHLDLAADDFRQALHILDKRQRSEFHDRDFRLNILSFLVGFEFYHAHPWAAQEYLKQADHLARQVGGGSLARGTCEWMHALIDRWAEKPDSALGHARAAAEIYGAHGQPLSAARINAVAADCVLDMAEPLELASTDRRKWLRRAGTLVRRARDFARKGQDGIAAEMIALTEVRLERLEGRDTGRMAAVGHALRHGRERNDLGLQGLALTALGDELLARDLPHAALDCYRRVRHLLAGSDVQATGVWASRAAVKLEQTL